MHTRKISVWLLGGGMPLLLVWVAMTQGPLAPVKVTVEKIQAGSLSNSVFGTGTLKARRSYNLAPSVTGRVKSVLADQGDQVVAGQVLVEMDPVDLEEKLAGSRRVIEKAAHSILALEAQLGEARSRLETLSATFARYEELQAQGFISQEMLDTKRLEKNAALAAMSAATANLAAARDEYAKAQADMRGIGKLYAQTKLVSPVSGVVVARLVEPGSTLAGGQVALQVIEPASLWVEARIAQKQAGQVRTGQQAEIVLRSQPHVPLTGKVERVNIINDTVTEERIINISFSGSQLEASIGEYAEVTIKLPMLNNIRSIPSAAIKRAGKQDGVWILKDNRVEFRPVKTGAMTMEGRTQILEGLGDGDTVIVYSQQPMRPELNVKVVPKLAQG